MEEPRAEVEGSDQASATAWSDRESRRGTSSTNYAAILSLGLKVGLVGASFGQSLLLARWMAPDEFGKFTIAFTVSIIIGSSATLGQHTAILRFLPEYKATGNDGLARAAVGFAFLLTSIGCCIALALYYPIVIALTRADPERFSSLLYAGPLIAAWAFSELLMGFLRALGFIAWSTAPRDLIWRLGIVAIALVILQLDGELSAEVLILWASAVLVLLVAAQAYVVRHAVSGPFQVRSNEARPKWVKTALTLTMATMISAIAAQADVPIIGVVLEPEQAGRFFVVQRVATILTVVGAAMNVFYAARFSELYYSNQRDELQRFTSNVAALVLSFSVPAYLVLLIWPNFVLSLFGAQYTEQTLELRVLATAYFIDAVSGPVGIVLLLSGFQNRHLSILSIAFLIRAAAVVTAALSFGLVGAAFASAFGQILMIVLLWWSVRERVGIETSVLSIGSLVHARRQ